jgi:excisionase family DNA binding protein
MTDIPRPRAYTAEQVAQALQVTKKQVYTLIEHGQIVAIRMGKYWRIPDHELERLLHSADVA